MKKMILCALALFGSLTMTTTVHAQQKVVPAQVTIIRAGGDFNNGTGDTSVRNWTDAQVPLYAKQDTVVLAASAGDSVRMKLIGEYNSVTLEAHATIYSGTSCDSVTVRFWGTASPGNGQGAFRLLQSTTLPVSTDEQVIQYLPASGVKNPYTNYRITYDVDDRVGTCTVKTNSYALIR